MRIFAGGGEELDMGGSERGGEGGVGSAEAVVQLRRAERGPPLVFYKSR